MISRIEMMFQKAYSSLTGSYQFEPPIVSTLIGRHALPTVMAGMLGQQFNTH